MKEVTVLESLGWEVVLSEIEETEDGYISVTYLEKNGNTITIKMR